MLRHLTFLALGLLALCSVEMWVFVVRYSRVRWYVTPEGRQVMKSHVVLALMFSMTLLFQVIQPTPEMGLTLSIVLFGWVAYEEAILIRLQYRAQRAREKRQ